MFARWSSFNTNRTGRVQLKAELVDFMGSDLSVVNAARASFAKVSTALTEGDKKLIRFLARGCSDTDWVKLVTSLDVTRIDVSPKSYYEIEQILVNLKNQAVHWTPFTHTAITLRMEAPLPIRTQCFKHKIGFTENEESRRYISTRPEYYVPDVWRKSAENVKQGSSDEAVVRMHDGVSIKKYYMTFMEDAIDTYFEMIQSGVCAEQARFVLPQGCEVNWIWTGNLASFARYYNQRTDSHAQKESQILAAQVATLIEPLFPESWKALTGEY
jgi:thymidylate synthase (FAD)